MAEISIESRLGIMELHEILEFHQPPYFRVMKVVNGWMYNFYDEITDNYMPTWIFVPETK